jgi:hypothetical protein
MDTSSVSGVIHLAKIGLPPAMAVTALPQRAVQVSQELQRTDTRTLPCTKMRILLAIKSGKFQYFTKYQKWLSKAHEITQCRK